MARGRPGRLSRIVVRSMGDRAVRRARHPRRGRAAHRAGNDLQLPADQGRRPRHRREDLRRRQGPVRDGILPRRAPRGAGRTCSSSRCRSGRRSARSPSSATRNSTPTRSRRRCRTSASPKARIFDRSALERAEQELKRQYITRGKYAASIQTTVTPQERNRVAINFTIDEGESAKIARINIVGAKAFTEKQLLTEMSLTTPGWFTWYTKNDQYSKQKLSGDLETLRSFYQNRGYLEFNVDSTQVSITPDKEDIYITLNITEGPRYTVGDVRIAGDLVVPASELERLVQLKPGDVFSREKLQASAQGHQRPARRGRLRVRERERRAGARPREAQGVVHVLCRPGPPRVRAARSTSPAIRRRRTR